MRNLKRVLSLALAVVMVIGMMVMGTSAVDFSDAADIDYPEAVDVMAALGVLEGYNGEFNPDDILTREQAAKIICYMLMGKANAEKLPGGSNYADVEADRWSAPYIAYCDSLGIISGYAGNFDPEGELTGVAFAKMLLCALGYDAAVEGYTGDNWATNIGSDAIDAGININGVSLDLPVSREQAAQMAFQTLTKTLVKYATKGTSITVGGVDIVTGAAEAEAQKWVDTGYDYETPGEGKVGGNDTETIQFCEKYFPGLKLTGGTADDFGRGADHGWALNNVEFYNELKTAKFVYTGKAQASKIVTDLKGYTFGGTKLESATTVYAGDGDDTWNETLTIGALSLNEDSTGVPAGDADVIATVLAGLTGNGKVVEIYVNPVLKSVTDVVVISSTVETIGNITTNPTTGDVTYTLSVSTGKIDYADPETTDQIVLHGEFAKGDVVTTVAGTTYLHVYPTTQFVGAQSAFNTTAGTVVIGGNTYTVGAGVSDGTDAVAVADFSNSATAANYYLDQYGYLVYTDSIDTTVVYTNYAQLKSFLTNVSTTVDGATPSIQGRFLLADGTVGVYDIALAYTAADGNYKLLGTTVFNDDGANGDDVSELDTGIANGGSALIEDEGVYAYSLDGNTITLQAVATVAANNTMVQDADIAISTGDTSASVASTTTLLDKNTVYVLYDGAKKTATTYVGALPTGAALTDNVVVALCNADASLASAKVVFGLASEVTTSPTASNEYAYVKATGYTTELKTDGTYRVYSAIKADGTTVTLYDKEDGSLVVDSTSGLYTWNSNNQITGTYTTGVIGAQTYTVVGDQMVYSTNVYNMDDASVVYIDQTKTAVNGNSCVVVLAQDALGNNTNNAVAIFVVG